MTAVLDKMCRSKRVFFTQKAANKVARKHGQRAYECPHCHTWHLTSKKPGLTARDVLPSSPGQLSTDYQRNAQEAKMLWAGMADRLLNGERVKPQRVYRLFELLHALTQTAVPVLQFSDILNVLHKEQRYPEAYDALQYLAKEYPGGAVVLSNVEGEEND